MKKYILCLLFVAFSFSGFAQKKIALVFDAGGKFDRSFNQSAWEGAEKARKDLGITLKDVEPADTTGVEEAMRSFADQNFDLIVAVGFANAPSLEKVGKQYPKTNFAIVDSYVDLPNVASLEFREEQGSFLVGMIAGMRSREIDGKRVAGFIGGMDIPLIHRFEQGFIQGAKTVWPTMEVVVNYVGNTPSAWNDPAKAKEIAKSQISSGATVIYAAAGGSGNGLFDAIKEMNGENPCKPQEKKCIYAIGVDSNQNYLVPGQILTSMLKRVDVAVYNTIKSVVDGNFSSGHQVFGLAENGVGYALDKHNKRLVTKKMAKVVDTYRNKIINGEIVVKKER